MARDLHVIDHPLVQHKLTLLRDKQLSTRGFRALTQEIGALLAYELMRDAPLKPVTVETPLGCTCCPRRAWVTSACTAIPSCAPRSSTT